MSKCCNIFTPTDVSTRNGVTTITLEDDVLSSICDVFYVDLTRVSLPTDSRNDSITITDGTITTDLYKCNQNYRACPYLPCNVLMMVKLGTDPQTTSTFCKYVPKRGGC